MTVLKYRNFGTPIWAHPIALVEAGNYDAIRLLFQPLNSYFKVWPNSESEAEIKGLPSVLNKDPDSK